MASAVGEVLPLAVGVALSPVPIVAVVLMLLTDRARVNGPVFVVAWLAGLLAIGAVVLLLLDPAGKDSSGEQPGWVGVVKLTLGALLLLVAAAQWRKRPRGDQEPDVPAWVSSIADFTPGKAGAAGVVLSALNPKNVVLAAAAAAEISQAGIAAAQEATAYLIFALLATLGVAVPVVIYLALSERAAELLERLRIWMTRNNAVITAILCLVIGATLLGDAISEL